MLSATNARHAPLNLTPVDYRVLEACSIRGYRFLTCRQMAGLFFTSRPACKERLEEMRRRRLVRRLFLPDTVNPWRSEAVFTLAGRGAKLLAEHRGGSQHFLARSSGRSYLFLRHSVRVSDFRLALEKALAVKGYRLLLWLNEWRIRDLNRTGRWPRLPRGSIIPDAIFSVELDGRRENFMLEVDLGSAPLRRIRDKMLAYIRFFRQGLHGELYGLPHFRVLIVSTTPSRVGRMLAILRDIGVCLNMFLTAPFPRGFGRQAPSPDIILQPIWRRCNEPEPFPLIV